MISTPISLQLPSAGDLATTLAWRNDETTRKSRKDTRFITLEEHIAWFIRRAAEETLWIGHLYGCPVGQITLDPCGEIGWVVGPQWRRCGVGKAMLTEALQRFPEATWAKVRVGNEASYELAKACGMVEQTWPNGENGNIYLVRP